MDFQQYLCEELEHGKPINENVVQAGITDTFKGNEYCGKHHHEYLLWYPGMGLGETGTALEEPVSGNAPVPGHRHMIVDGKVLEYNGHTHELNKPTRTSIDVTNGEKESEEIKK